jgi:hypothetical protein
MSTGPVWPRCRYPRFRPGFRLRWIVQGADYPCQHPGYDLSYPQCGATLPAGAFGIVGVDGGRPYDVNPCMAEEILWAGSPAYYANTANPGPKKSTHWPKGQTSPKVCETRSPNSKACSFDYGWNAAKDSYARAATAASAAGAAPVSTATWWLDVENGNSWQSVDRSTRNLSTETVILVGWLAPRDAESPGPVRTGALTAG